MNFAQYLYMENKLLLLFSVFFQLKSQANPKSSYFIINNRSSSYNIYPTLVRQVNSWKEGFHFQEWVTKTVKSEREVKAKEVHCQKLVKKMNVKMNSHFSTNVTTNNLYCIFLGLVKWQLCYSVTMKLLKSHQGIAWTLLVCQQPPEYQQASWPA